jgi:regulatory protein YycI of two-component signal transduction system YycFG
MFKLIKNIYSGENKLLLLRTNINFILTFSIITSFILFIYFTTFETEQTALEENERRIVKLQSSNIISDLNNIISDLIYLTENHEMINMLKPEMTFNQRAMKDLSDDLLKFSSSRKLYDQIRFIDAEGTEIIRINFNENNPQKVDKSNLQNKKHRYYLPRR